MSARFEQGQTLLTVSPVQAVHAKGDGSLTAL